MGTGSSLGYSHVRGAGGRDYKMCDPCLPAMTNSSATVVSHRLSRSISLPRLEAVLELKMLVAGYKGRGSSADRFHDPLRLQSLYCVTVGLTSRSK